MMALVLGQRVLRQPTKTCFPVQQQVTEKLITEGDHRTELIEITRQNTKAVIDMEASHAKTVKEMEDAHMRKVKHWRKSYSGYAKRWIINAAKRASLSIQEHHHLLHPHPPSAPFALK